MNRFIILMLLGATFLFGASNVNGKGDIFVGSELGFGSYTNPVLGINGGYKYYFDDAWQFTNFRHGIKGTAGFGWSKYDKSETNHSRYNVLYFHAGADWIIDFTPRDRFVWGAFAGLGLDFVKPLAKNTTYKAHPVLFDVNAGASLGIDKIHRFEIGLGSGISVLFARYAYVF